MYLSIDIDTSLVLNYYLGSVMWNFIFYKLVHCPPPVSERWIGDNGREDLPICGLCSRFFAILGEWRDTGRMSTRQRCCKSYGGKQSQCWRIWAWRPRRVYKPTGGSFHATAATERRYRMQYWYFTNLLTVARSLVCGYFLPIHIWCVYVKSKYLSLENNLWFDSNWWLNVSLKNNWGSWEWSDVIIIGVEKLERGGLFCWFHWFPENKMEIRKWETRDLCWQTKSSITKIS